MVSPSARESCSLVGKVLKLVEEAISVSQNDVCLRKKQHPPSNAATCVRASLFSKVFFSFYIIKVLEISQSRGVSSKRCELGSASHPATCGLQECDVWAGAGVTEDKTATCLILLANRRNSLRPVMLLSSVCMSPSPAETRAVAACDRRARCDMRNNSSSSTSLSGKQCRLPAEARGREDCAGFPRPAIDGGKGHKHVADYLPVRQGLNSRAEAEIRRTCAPWLAGLRP